MGFLRPWEGMIYAVMRVLVGLLFMQHGLQKILGMFGGPPPGMPAPLLYLTGAIELVGGPLIAIGFHAALAAFICSGTMAVAYFMAHAPRGFFPIENHGELAILYCWIFLLIAGRGAGRFSIDRERR